MGSIERRLGQWIAVVTISAVMAAVAQTAGTSIDATQLAASAGGRQAAQLPGCVPIAFGTTTTGTILLPLEADCYTFPGASGDQILIRVVETSGLLTTLFAQTMVLRPNGTTVCPANVFRERLCRLDATGTHELIVRDDTGTGVGNYSLYVQRMNNPVGCSTLSFGQTVTGTINAPAEADCYRFTGAAGDVVELTVDVTVGVLNGEIAVFRPDGSIVCPNATAVGPITCALDTTGTHTILVKDNPGTQTGTYTLTLGCDNPPCGTNGSSTSSTSSTSTSSTSTTRPTSTSSTSTTSTTRPTSTSSTSSTSTTRPTSTSSTSSTSTSTSTTQPSSTSSTSSTSTSTSTTGPSSTSSTSSTSTSTTSTSISSTSSTSTSTPPSSTTTTSTMPTGTSSTTTTTLFFLGSICDEINVIRERVNETIVQFEQAVLSLLGASQGQAALAQLEAARTHVNAQLDEALAQCRAAVALVEQVAIVQRMLTSVTVPTIPLPAR